MWTLKIHLNSKDEFGHDIKEVNSITVQHGQLKTLYDRLISFYVAEGKRVTKVDLFENEKQVLSAVPNGHIFMVEGTRTALATWIREKHNQLQQGS
jgi:hypothetical protein